MACHPDQPGRPPPRRPLRPDGDHLPDYADPATEAEAEDRLRELTFSIQMIETHLGDRARAASMREADYDRWRVSASVALRVRQEEKRRVAQWLRRHRRARQEECGRARRLLGALYDLLMELAGDAGATVKGANVVEEAGEYLGRGR